MSTSVNRGVYCINGQPLVTHLREYREIPPYNLSLNLVRCLIHLLNKKDLNLNPAFNFFNGYIPFSYFIMPCAIHHSQSRVSNLSGFRLITPKTCCDMWTRTTEGELPNSAHETDLAPASQYVKKLLVGDMRIELMRLMYKISILPLDEPPN